MVKAINIWKTLGATFLGVGALSVCSAAVIHTFNDGNKAEAVDYSSSSHIDNYYSSVNGKGTTLLSSVSAAISSPFTIISYSNLKDYYEITDSRDDGYLYDIYSSNTNYTISNGGSSASTVGIGWNKEHTIPQSWWGGGTTKQGCDIIIVRLSDIHCNSVRGNYLFGEVETSTDNTIDDNKLGNCSNYNEIGVTSSTVVFEPRDEIKGDMARTYFYAAARYYSSGEGNGEASAWTTGNGAKVFSSSGNNGFVQKYLKMLLRWHVEDPVDQREITRNANVESCQKNRNPFVDHPSWVDLIWGGTYSGKNAEDTSSGSVVKGKLDGGSSSSSSSEESSSTPSSSEAASSSSQSTSSDASSESILSTDITLTGESSGMTGTDGQQTVTEGGATFRGVFKQYSTTAIWLTGDSGYIYNTTNLGVIDRVTINYKSGGSTTAAQALSFGTSAIATKQTSPSNGTSFSSSNSSSPNSFEPTSEYGYFNLSSTNKKNIQITSIVIEHHNSSSSSSSESSSEATPATLSSIAVKTAPTKTTYTEGEYFNPTGLVITATYSNSSKQDVSYSSSPSSFTFSPTTSTALTTSNTSITITYNGKACNQSITVTGSNTPFAVNTPATMYFTKSSTNFYYTGSMVNTYYGQCSTNLADAMTVYLETNGTGYNIYFNNSNGKQYLKPIASGQYVNFSYSTTSTSYGWKFDTNTGAYYYVVNSTNYIFCGDSTHTTFSPKGLDNIASYFPAKFMEIDSAEKWGQSFIETLTCNNGATAPSTSVWATLKTRYTNLSTYEKGLVDSATANENGTTYLEQAIARYVEVLSKYSDRTSYPNYLNKAGYSNTIRFVPTTKKTSVALLAVFGIVSVFLGIGFFSISTRKKNEN